MSVLSLKNITKSYAQGAAKLDVLSGVNLEVEAGELVALVGPSGCGKSTLLHIAGLLDTPDSGTVAINGKDYTGLSDAARTEVRRNKLGFIYQFHHLLPEFSAQENVMLPQMVAGKSKEDARKKAAETLSLLGLKERLTHRPGELSGGEQQRVAIARALANDPVLLLADEPTGNLDPHTAAEVFKHLKQLITERRLAVLMVTHNLDLADAASRKILFSKN